jgi:hypothetical protein
VRSWLTASLLAVAAIAAAQVRPAMPNPKLTPGEVRTIDAKQVCSTSTKEFRKTTEAMKKQVCREYGVKVCPHEGTLEIDHLIPLELGGADTVTNLWPQPASPKPGFHEKDKLENYLHAQVCAGKMALTDAQAMIRTDWYAAYKGMK